MKRYSLIGLLTLLVAVTVWAAIVEVPEAPARMTAVVVGGSGGGVTGCSDPTGILVVEEAEGTGTPTNWTDTPAADGSVDWDDTTATVLRGAQQAELVGGTGLSYAKSPNFTNSDTVHAHFRLRMADGRPASSTTICQLLDSGGSARGSIEVRTNGAVKVYQGGIGSAESSVIFPDGDTGTYHVWLDYTKESDEGVADGTAHVFIGQSGTKPAAVAQTTAGDAVAQIQNIRFRAGAGVTMYVDQIYVNSTDIGDVCP